LTLTNATLSLAAASQINSTLTQNGGTIAGAGNLTVTGSLAWNGGTMTGSGTTFANGGMTITTSLLSAARLVGRPTLTNAVMATWTASGTFNTFGIATNAVLNNTGTFDVQTDNSFVNNSGVAGTITNTGTFRKSVTTGTTDIPSAINFNNNGTVDVQVG